MKMRKRKQLLYRRLMLGLKIQELLEELDKATDMIIAALKLEAVPPTEQKG